jgi:trehalose synthase-fused probable maltokinase
MLLAAAFDEAANHLERACPQAVVAALAVEGPEENRTGLIYDALWNHDAAWSLLRAIRAEEQFSGGHGMLVASSTEAFAESLLEAASAGSSVLKAEQSNTSVKFGSHIMMKLYRRCEPGRNPDLEIGRVLTARGFSHSPRVLGALEYCLPSQEPATVAIVHAFIPNQGDAWRYTLDVLERELAPSSCGSAGTTALSGGYADSAETLGRRTAELHLALAQATDDPALAPEPCTPAYWRRLADRMTSSIADALALLRSRLSDLNEEARRQADLVLAMERDLASRAGALVKLNLEGLLIRCHGDFHLGQVLYTGRDFVIIDFEGEPARPLAERRAKHVPIVDVAGMLRSFHYAAHVGLQGIEKRAPDARPSDLKERARQWYEATAKIFVASYLAAGTAPFWPASPDERDMLLEAYVIEKACYELSYELNNRPGWVGVPLNGLLQLGAAKRNRT